MESNQYQYWTEMSQYDFETALAMLKSKRYLYVGFMLHQTIEKIFKAYYVYLKKATPPFTHNLSKLAVKGEFYKDIPEKFLDTIDILEPLNVEARYPSQKDRLFSELTEERCGQLIEDTEVLYKWILSKLRKT